MSITDKYELETATYGTSNWNSILTSNMQKIDDAVQSQMLETSGEAISTIDAVGMHADGKIYKVQTVASGTQYICLGLSTEDIAASDTEMRIYRDGIVTCSGYDWTVGYRVYLDDVVNGGLTQVPTLSGVDYQIIGIAIGSNVLDVMLGFGGGDDGDGGGGVTDHGLLLGLGDDDHTQYHNNTRGDARYYTQSQVDALTWTESDITDLDKYTQAEVDTISGSLSSEIDSDISIHAASNDHDNRYYTESEVDTISGTLQTDIDAKGDMNDVVDDITPQLGGDLNTNQKNIILQPIPTSNQEANGYIATMTVDINTVGFGGALHMDVDGNWIDATASGTTTMPCEALALEIGTGSKKVLLRGFIRDDNWDWNIGAPMYMSRIVGQLTQTAPTTTGDQVQILGFATHGDRIFFNPISILGEVV